MCIRDRNLPGKKMTALVGHSGAGKSTILNLIPRFYNANNGDIRIDNQSIYDCKISSLRRHISLVSQDTTLFDDTIKNNIAYADMDATDEEIYRAAGKPTNSSLLELATLAKEIGRKPIQRNTFFKTLQTFT